MRPNGASDVGTGRGGCRKFALSSKNGQASLRLQTLRADVCTIPRIARAGSGGSKRRKVSESPFAKMGKKVWERVFDFMKRETWKFVIQIMIA